MILLISKMDSWLNLSPKANRKVQADKFGESEEDRLSVNAFDASQEKMQQFEHRHAPGKLVQLVN